MQEKVMQMKDFNFCEINFARKAKNGKTQMTKKIYSIQVSTSLIFTFECLSANCHKIFEFANSFYILFIYLHICFYKLHILIKSTQNC